MKIFAQMVFHVGTDTGIKHDKLYVQLVSLIQSISYINDVVWYLNF